MPCLLPGHLYDPGIELVALMSPALAGRFFTTSTTWEAQINDLSNAIFKVDLIVDLSILTSVA